MQIEPSGLLRKTLARLEFLLIMLRSTRSMAGATQSTSRVFITCTVWSVIHVPAVVRIHTNIHVQNLLRQTLHYNYDHYRDLGTGAFKNNEFVVKRHVSKYPSLSQI